MSRLFGTVVTFLCNSKSLPKFCSSVDTNFLSNVIGKLTNPESTKNLSGTLQLLLVRTK